MCPNARSLKIPFVLVFLVTLIAPRPAWGQFVVGVNNVKGLEITLVCEKILRVDANGHLVLEDPKADEFSRISTQVDGRFGVREDGLWCFKRGQTITFPYGARLHLDEERTQPLTIVVLTDSLDSQTETIDLPVVVKAKNDTAGKHFILRASGLAALLMPVEEQPPSGIMITASAARIAHRAQRYSAVKNLPKENHVEWQMSKGSVFSEAVREFSQPDNTDILDVLLQFTNTAKVEAKVEIKTLVLEAAGKQYNYWEFLPGEVYTDYEYMAQRLQLSQETPKGELFAAIEFKGSCYCTLKPKQKAWVAVVFFIPSEVKSAKLIAELPEKRTIDLTIK